MENNIQKDLVLSINEYAYVMDETKGHVICWVGPSKTSLSNSDRLVRFDAKEKKFVPCSYSDAINLFTITPENWYCILKNPVEGGRHPNAGANNLPENIDVGRKINLRGPMSFALYPGQMAQVVKGHTLRSNQYLLARVYEAETANTSQGEARDANGELIENQEKYVNGQILVIKGTEISFYIPPTGIEVIPINNDISNGYVRDAVSLERLEYCILKDENGNKRYVHGPQVVFPKPTEVFVTNKTGGYIFRAVELSPISGIYIKVVAEYTDDKNVVHPVGEEMFITGNEQMIYYPRPEHAVINYDGKMIHHAIAIPAGEGRYIMNRLTGDIRTVFGPAMYLPDPQTEVVVKRKLTPHQCELWYPGNTEAYAYNAALSETFVEKSTKAITNNLGNFVTMSCFNAEPTLTSFETNASISRGTSYTKPRTVTLDTKYEGVVSIDVWTGYAINLISKTKESKTVCGPQTVLLDYDQTLEVLNLSTGKPKTDNKTIETVFLRYTNNKVSDIIQIETKDYVKAAIKVSYCVDFELEYQDRWFSIDNYVKYLCDRERSLIKRAAKNYTIEEFYQDYSKIVRDIALNRSNNTVSVDTDINKRDGLFFPENGMIVHDCEVLDISVEDSIAQLLEEHQYEMVNKALELSTAERRIAVAKALAEAEKREMDINHNLYMEKLAYDEKENTAKMEAQSKKARLEEAEKKAGYQAELDYQDILDDIQEYKLARQMEVADFNATQDQAKVELENAKREAYARSVEKIMASISPDLIAAMTSRANADVLDSVSKNLSPYAIAQGTSVADTINTLMRGTSLEKILENLPSTKNFN